jgi:hypothetical protein
MDVCTVALLDGWLVGWLDGWTVGWLVRPGCPVLGRLVLGHLP